MSINTDGQKRQGRFLKKNSKVIKNVSMVDFNFEEILTHPLVGFDNIDRSIIHAKFHDPEQLKTVIKHPHNINEKVHDPNIPQLGVIFPADFTQDWHNERINSKRRALGFDDDDEIDIAEVARNRGQAAAKAQAANAAAADVSASSEPTQATTTQPQQEAAHTQHPVHIISAHPSSPAAIRGPMNDGKVQSLNEQEMAQAINKAQISTPTAPVLSKNSIPQEGEFDEHEDDQSFTPLPTDNSNNEIGAEDRAIASWKSKQQLQKQNEQALEELKAEARAEGFQAGFREGEEKGLLSGKKEAANVFSKVSEILHEFEGLKGLILDNVQKNFYELSQAIGEALLGREFSIKPEAYATMIQRVVKDTVAPNEFKVKMHPETWQKVHDLEVPDLDQYLVKDTSIPQGEFRVESALTVVDVNAKKLVSQLLEKVDMNLFENKKAV